MHWSAKGERGSEVIFNTPAPRCRIGRCAPAAQFPAHGCVSAALDWWLCPVPQPFAAMDLD
eukprot:902216-Lingulodinium_polyedra.AAC.1